MTAVCESGISLVGDFVLTEARLDEHVPIGNAAMEKRRFIEWDKDDIDKFGMMRSMC